jgi:hypothetical protein
MRITLIFLSLAGTVKLFSQTNIPISGPSPVYIGTQHTYVADLSGMTQTPGSTVTWSVTGGAIVSAITDPTAASVYCVVRWSYASGTAYTFTLSASVNSPAQAGTKQVVVNCRQTGAGSDVSICPGDSATLGAPAVPGYTYLWNSTPGLSSTTIAQPVASPTQTTSYFLRMFPSSPNLMTNGYFENGYADFGSDYVLYPDATNTNGTYEVTTNPHSLNTAWRSFSDYSLTGHMLIADGSVYTDPSGYRFWYTTLDVHPHLCYSFNLVKKPLVANNSSSVRLTFTGNNSGSLVWPADGGTYSSTFEVNGQMDPSYQGWSGYGLNWCSGNNTQVTIEMRYLPIIGNPAYSNQLAFDDITFQEMLGCSFMKDTVIVSVGNRPAVSPSGPIEYYYLEENISPQIGVTLASESLPGYQWYKDGVAISGATSQTYKAKSTGTYTVQGSGCPSDGVIFYDHAKGPDERTIIGESLDFPGGVHSPSYYCYNSTNYIRQFDLGSSANYYWETYTPGGASHQLTINSSTYNVHSPQADVNIGGSPANPTTILGYAELDGYVRAMEFSHFYYTSQSTPLTGTAAICAGSSFSVTNYNSFTSSEINPGASRFDWETYDVGSGGEILVPDPTLYPDPADPTNTKKIRIAGKNGYTGGITVRMNTLPGRIKKYFYTDDGDCYQDSKRYEADPGCRMSQSENDGVNLFPNPARSTVTISAPDNILSVEITGINNYITQQAIRKKTDSRILNLNISQYKPGVYNCRITTTSGVVNKKLVVSP